jgi:uncharacterized protein (DUF58 family)
MARPPRRAIPTRAGLFVLAAPIVLGLAAMSATNNLLFIMLGAALGSIVISGILSEWNVRGVRVRVEPASSVFAGEPSRIRVIMERELPSAHPSYGLRVRERRGSIWRIFAKADPRLLDATLPVLEERRAEILGERTFEARGRARFLRTELVTTYPFALLHKSRDLEVEADLVVRPRRIPVPAALADPRSISAEGELSTRRGIGIEIYGLREHRDGDAIHRLHALRSLSLGTDVSVETTGMERPTAWIGIANDEGVDPVAFERALEVVAAALVEWDRRGYAVGLSTVSARFAPGEASLDRLLDTLALLRPEKETGSGRGPPVWIVPAGGRARGRTVAVSKDGAIA